MNIIKDYPFSRFSTLKLKDEAAYYCELSNISQIEDITAFANKENLPIFFLGEGTNIVPSKYYKGLIVKNKLLGIQENDNSIIEVASGENWHDFVKWSLMNNKFGLENLALIPGTVGAGPVQNIGAYGSEISNYVKQITAFNLKNNSIEILDNNACEFGYRKSIFQKRSELIILSVTFNLDNKPKINCSYGSLKEEMKKIGIQENEITPNDVFHMVSNIRNRVLPNHLELPNVGSFFKNSEFSKEEFKELNLSSEIPVFIEQNICKIPSAFLIERAGWKGFKRGAVGISNKHSLVLITYQETTGSEVISFANEIIEDVLNKTDIKLSIEPTVI